MPRRRIKSECTIIGGGPGGMTAALYLKRFRREVTLVDAGDSRVGPVPKLRNLAGYYDGISGKELLARITKQLQSYRLDIIKEKARVFKSAKGFRVLTSSYEIEAKTVLLATGMKDRQPEIDNYFELCRRGALGYCAVCEGYDHKNEMIGVITNSPANIGKIKFIAHLSPRLCVILTRGRWNSQAHDYFKKNNIRTIRGDIESLSWNLKTKNLVVKLVRKEAFELKMAYVEMGSYVPDMAFQGLKEIKRSRDGFILVNAKQQTSIPGLYAVGDCVNALSQVSVAIGQAAIAATRIHNELLNQS